MVQCHTPYTGEALGERERPPFPVGKGALLDGALFAGGFYRGVLGDGEGNGILQHGIGGQVERVRILSLLVTSTS